MTMRLYHPAELKRVMCVWDQFAQVQAEITRLNKRINELELKLNNNEVD